MELKSKQMQLNPGERGWLPWWGKTGKVAMSWSCFINRHLYPLVEQTFEGIAATRMQILLLWTKNQWSYLSSLAKTLNTEDLGSAQPLLARRKTAAGDFSEIFIIDTGGKVIASTHPAHVGLSDLPKASVTAGLRAPFLHGPYKDPLTKTLGPSSSRFHDDVTLMFYQPIQHAGQTAGIVCGRVPNDVIGDLIQRESGHVYKESGDNYLFMVESRMDPSIKPGTALSRSRFEDAAFSLGDNLKQGVNTRYGIVKVAQHTELELRFTDPASKELHPGVRETIKKGDNLFVTYPGYPDYRHVPVIGKGITLQLAGSPDRWGMMCEGDLEEVYRHRSINLKLMRWFLAIVTLLLVATNALSHYAPSLGGVASAWVQAGLIGLATSGFYWFATRNQAARLREMIQIILSIAECGGNLEQRLDEQRLAFDEAGDLGRWINSFIGKMNDIVKETTTVAEQVASSAAQLSRSAGQVAQASSEQRDAAASTATAVEETTTNIQQAAVHAKETAAISDKASTLSAHGEAVVHKAAAEITRIADSVAQTSQFITSLGERSKEISGIVEVIRGIADQTNLLALNAAIEAARAGEQGRGFAVVADEVRSLAKHTTQATAEITKMIRTIQSETSNAVASTAAASQQAQQGVVLANEAGEALTQINHGARHTMEMIMDIERATGQLSIASNEIAKNIEMISCMARDNSLAVEQTHSAADHLEQLASSLQNTVARFK